ncbi:MAG TPA: hypothetical protein ENI73_10270 [Spirochaetes bacterium]|nr:hypothetical protein [Spirochaetota bacterium]
MRFTVTILILLVVAMPAFSKEQKAKYIKNKASKRFEVVKFYQNYLYNPYLQKLELNKALKPTQIKDNPRYYKAVYDGSRSLVRIEEIRDGRLYGFYLFFYDTHGTEIARSQYHYIGSNKKSSKENAQFHIDVQSDTKEGGYFISYYSDKKLVKREFYYWGGKLGDSKTFEGGETKENRKFKKLKGRQGGKW